MLSFNHASCFCTSYKIHSNLKCLRNPNQNENITPWKALKTPNFRHIHREKDKFTHIHTHIHGERQGPCWQCRWVWPLFTKYTSFFFHSFNHYPNKNMRVNIIKRQSEKTGESVGQNTVLISILQPPNVLSKTLSFN